jgi:NAD(P)-dependent dehydrogenase (short-subunit alcohol dehydrogenase family)
MRLNGKVCVVTGASSGIGRRVATDLAEAGATVCAVARREERLRDLLPTLAPVDGSAHSYFVADVSARSETRLLASHVAEKHGRCDVLVNNAGISRGKTFEGESSIEDLEEVFQTNFFGAVYCTAALLPLLESSAPSNIVNVASMAGRLAYGDSSAYCASKFALVGWSESVHYDLERKRIAVSLIEPGPVPTEGFPQTALIGHPILRGSLSSAGDVSRAVKGVIRTGKMQRVVPRWFYLLQLPRILVPPLYRSVVRRLIIPSAGGR